MVVNLYIDKNNQNKDVTFRDTVIHQMTKDKDADFEVCLVNMEDEHDAYKYFLDEKRITKDQLPVLLMNDSLYSSNYEKIC